MCRKRSTGVLISACLLLVPAAGAWASDASLAARIDSLFSSMPHATFEWSGAAGVSERASMRIPVDLDGTKGWFQMDTGLDATVVYGDLPAEHGWDSTGGMYRAPDLKLGQIDVGPVWIRAQARPGQKGEVIGSLGLDLLVGHLVVIDYPGRRLALLEVGEAPAWLWRHASWTPATLRDGKLFLYVTLSGEGVGDLIFDTGSSAFDLVVDFDDWTALTGVESAEAAPIHKAVNSWGAEVTAVGAPATGPLTIGSVHIAHPQVFFLKEQPELFSSWPFPARGVIGNAPFWDQVVLLDLGLRPRFGLLE